MKEVIDFANDRPIALNDDLYQWAVDAEELLRTAADTIARQQSDINVLRSLCSRWLNDTMTAEDIRVLEQQTLEQLTCQSKHSQCCTVL